MPVQDPRQLHQAWEKAYHDGDVDALVEFYEPDGTVFAQPGSPVSDTLRCVRHCPVRRIEGADATTNY